jgi:general stress protein YciG
VSERRRGPITGTPQAKHGGDAVRERYGREYYQRIGKKGGERLRATRDAEYYREIGRRGGEATHERHGTEFYSRIGKAGGSKGSAIPLVTDEAPAAER